MCTTFSWWRHQMETFSALLAICAGNSPVPGEFTAQRPVTRSFDVFFDLRLNKPLSKQWWGWWLETLSRPLWRHCNAVVLFCGGGDATISCQWNHRIHLPIFSGLLQNRPLPYPVYDIAQNHYSCNGLPIVEGCVFSVVRKWKIELLSMLCLVTDKTQQSVNDEYDFWEFHFSRWIVTTTHKIYFISQFEEMLGHGTLRDLMLKDAGPWMDPYFHLLIHCILFAS